MALDSRGRNSLHLAGCRCDASLGRFLLLNGAKAVIRDRQGNRVSELVPVAARQEFVATVWPLHYAIASGDQDRAMTLIADAADNNSANDFGITPIQEAATWGMEKVVAALESRGAVSDIFVDIALNRREAVKGELKSIAPLLSRLTEEVLFLSLGRPTSTRRFGANTDYTKHVDCKKRKGETPISLALKFGYQDMVDALRNSKIDQRLIKETASQILREAIKSADVEVIKVLLKNGAEPKRSARSRRSSDILRGQSTFERDVLRLLIESGSAVNQQDGQGRTPLFVATEENHPEAISVLLEKGADPNIATATGEVPLHEAARSNANVTDALLQAGADPNLVDSLGESSLFAALEAPHEQIVKVVSLLLEHNA